MSMHRGRVTASDTAGVYVQTAEFGALGPLQWVGAKPAVGASVLVSDTGRAGQPDLVAVTGLGGVTIDASNNMTVPAQFLNLTPTSGFARIYINPASGSAGDVRFTTATSVRWVIGKESSAESGANVGSDFVLRGYADNGSTLISEVRVDRSTGKVTLGAAGATAGLELGTSGPRIMAGTGSPESVVTAPVGSLWLRTDSATTLYVKQTGTGNTGWVSK